MEKISKKIAVLGMGTEGIAVARFLLDQGVKSITLLDRQEEEKLLEGRYGEEKNTLIEILNDKRVSKIFDIDYLSNLTQFDLIFRTPGISINNEEIQKAIKSGAKVSSQIKLFLELCPCKIIGVTGTKGKGTTASLISEILKKSTKLEALNSKQIINNKNLNQKNISDFGFRISDFSRKVYLAGNIGTPAISLIPQLTEYDIVILELSSFQLMDLEKSPHVAVMTNLLVDHLDYHINEEEYRTSKFNIFKFQNDKDIAILNSVSTYDQEKVHSIKSQKVWFGNGDEKEKCSVVGEEVIFDPKGSKDSICKLSELKLFGKHNLYNIAAATLAASSLNIDLETVKDVVKDFKGLPHRIELVDVIDGVKYIDDSFATNPGPTMAALDSFESPKILILGGSSKGSSFDEMAKKITESRIKAVILIGDEAGKIEESLKKAGFSGKYILGKTEINEIVKSAKDLASEGDVVLLSPACASFGLFKNYKDRGEKFKAAVNKLKTTL